MPEFEHPLWCRAFQTDVLDFQTDVLEFEHIKLCSRAFQTDVLDFKETIKVSKFNHARMVCIHSNCLVMDRAHGESFN
jgi:hypothetical protein